MAVMGTESLVHEYTFEVVPDLIFLPGLGVFGKELSHVERERVRDCVLRLGPRKVLEVESEAQERKMKNLDSAIESESRSASATVGSF